MSKRKIVEINKESWPTKEEANLFSILFPMINSDPDEIRELSKKKQDEPLNKFKIKILNNKLEKAKSILKNEQTVEFLDLLDEENLPTNSDAVLQISQFINSMSNFRQKYYSSSGEELGLENGEEDTWKTKD
jgi:hypothetical protein